eukprot:6478880-Amphidinium_carterae.1
MLELFTLSDRSRACCTGTFARRRGITMSRTHNSALTLCCTHYQLFWQQLAVAIFANLLAWNTQTPKFQRSV